MTDSAAKTQKAQKTYKREVATLQLVAHWALIAGIVFIAIANPSYKLDALVSLAIGLAIWVYGFAAAAFGLDALAKQIRGS